MPTTMKDAQELAESYAANLSERKLSKTKQKLADLHRPKPDTLGCTCGWPNGTGDGSAVFATDPTWFITWAMVHVPGVSRGDAARRKYVRRVRWQLAGKVLWFCVALFAAFTAVEAEGAPGFMKLSLFSVNIILALWVASMVIVDLDTLRRMRVENFWGEISEMRKRDDDSAGV